MSIRPKYGKRSVLQVLSDGMSQRPPTGKSCCEEAALNEERAEKAEAERDEARKWLHETEARLDETKDERDEWKRTAANALQERDLSWKSEARLTAERDELQAKLDAAEQRPTLNREAVRSVIRGSKDRGDLATGTYLVHEDEVVDAIMALAPAEGWPEWLGPKINPDDFNPERAGGTVFRVDGRAMNANNAEEARDAAQDYVRVAASYEAVARFIESEQAATDDEDQRVEKQAIAFYYAPKEVDSRLPWNSLDEHQREQYRAAIRAGWTPPESEASE